jgi:group I intron endonuclease
LSNPFAQLLHLYQKPELIPAEVTQVKHLSPEDKQLIHRIGLTTSQVRRDLLKDIQIQWDRMQIYHQVERACEHPIVGAAAELYGNYCCLTGDTKIPLLDGRTLKIQEIFEEYKSNKNLWVYSCDYKGKPQPAKILHAIKQDHKPNVFRIWLDNGKYVDASDNHRFIRRDGSLCRADELKVNDSLMPFHRSHTKNGYETIWNILERSKAISETKRGVGSLIEKCGEFTLSNNHKITKIECIGHQEVYDLTVDGSHLFGLDAGIYVHNTVLSPLHNSTCWVTSDSPTYQRELTKLLDRIGVEESIFDWAYSTGTYGDLFVKINGIPGKGIISVDDNEHPLMTSRVDHEGALIGYYKAPLGQIADAQKLIPPWEYVHFRLLGGKKKRPRFSDPMYTEFRTMHLLVGMDIKQVTTKYGTSLLMNALPCYRRLRLAEDSLLLARLSRGLIRYVWKLRVSHCLRGNTKISLMDGTNPTIQEMAEIPDRFVGRYVLTVNESTKHLEPNKIKNVQKTRLNAQLVRVHLDNGKYVDCTPDHKLLCRNGEYREAQDLQPNDSLMPLYARFNKMGQSLLYDPRSSKYKKLSDISPVLYGYIYKTTNLANGKEYIGQKKGIFNPFYLGSGIRLLEAIKKYGRDKFKVEFVSWAHNKKEANKLEKKYISNYRTTQEECGILYNLTDGGDGTEGSVRSKESRKKSSKSLKNFYSSEEGKKVAEAASTRMIQDNPTKNPATRRKMSESQEFLYENGYVNPFLGKNHTEKTKEKNRQWHLGRKHSNEANRKTRGGVAAFDATERGKKVRHEAAIKAWETRRQKAQLMECLLNHKVVRIEWLKKREDTYDIEIENTPNFPLEAGVFVHNSSMEAVGELVDQYSTVLREARALNTRPGAEAGFEEKENPMSCIEDIFLPVWDNVGDLTYDKIGGEADIRWIKDVEDLRQQLAAALRCPLPLLGAYLKEAAGPLGSEIIEKVDINFARIARKLQRTVRNGIKRICQIHLAWMNMDPDPNLFDIQMPEMSTAEEESLKDSLNSGTDVIAKFMSMMDDIEGEGGKKIDRVEVFNYLNEKILKLEDFDLTEFMTSIEAIPECRRRSERKAKEEKARGILEKAREVNSKNGGIERKGPQFDTDLFSYVPTTIYDGNGKLYENRIKKFRGWLGKERCMHVWESKFSQVKVIPEGADMDVKQGQKLLPFAK